MRGTRWIETGLCAVLLLSGGPALAAKSPPRAQPQGAEGDREFLRRALGVNELELQLGRLAAERANTSQLKAAAEKMVQNHTKLGQQLSELAQRAGVSGNAEMSSDERKTFDRVKSQSGSSFDSTFEQTVDAGHVTELAMYRDEVGRAANPRLGAFVEQRVAALQQAVAAAEQREAEQRVKNLHEDER